MAKVAVRVVGQSQQFLDADTVGGLKTQLGLKNYSASVNREPATDSQTLEDDDFVTFAQSVKGGF